MPADAPLRRSPKRKAPARRKPPVVRRAPSRGPQGLPGRQGQTRPAVKPRPVYGPPTPKRLTPAVQQQARIKTRKRLERQQQARRQRMVNLQGDSPADYHRGAEQAARAIKQARIAHLRDTRKQIHPTEIPGILRRLANRELEGKGVLAGLSHSLSSHVDIRPGGVQTAESRLGLKKSGVVNIPDRIAKDLLNAPAQALPAVYVPAAAGVEALRGKPKRLKQLGKDIDKGDPLFNLAAAGIEKLKGNDKAAAKRFKRATKAAKEHPGFTLLEAYGAKGTVGRGSGRAMRSGALGKKAQRAGSTKREPRTIPGTAIVEHRQYSPDIFRKRAQVRREDSARGEANEMRRTADRIEANNPGRAAELRRKAVRVDPDRMPAKEIRRRVDERVDANETVRREHRGRITHQVHQIVKPATKTEREALSLVAQNIVHASKGDMRAYVKQLEAEAPTLDRAGRLANKNLRAQLQKVIDGEIDPARIRKVASDYEALTTPLQKGLVDRGLLDKDQAERSALIPYAVRRMGAHHDPEKGIVGRDGEPLSTAAIKAHMKDHNVSPAAFLTQAPNQRGARNFNVRSEQPNQIRTARRTGESTRKGTFDAHVETLTENAARSQGLIDAVDGFKDFVGEFSLRGEDSRPVTHTSKKDVDRVIDNLNARDNEVKFRAIRVSPFGARKELLDKLLDQPDAQQIDGFRDLMDEALQGKGDEGPWAIIPEAAADQLRLHLRAMGPGATAKAWQVFNSQFRQTVLATSPSWIAGNVIEGALRTGLAKAGPRSYMTGKRVLAELQRTDPKAAEAAAARAVAGGHFSFAKRADVRRDASQFEDTYLEDFATAMGKLRRTPGPKQVADAWNSYTDFVFNRLNGRLESKYQTAMLGKALRDSPLMDGQTNKLSKVAIEQAAKGLKGTNEQVALGRAVDRMYGQYGKFSPARKMVVAYYTPFIAWTINAAKFVVDVLPRDHPTATAVIAASEIATDEWRKDHGLDLFMQGRVPNWLQGTIPISGGRRLPASRYTPFGAFGDPLNTAGSAVLPQIRSVLNIWTQNEDWKGTPIRKKNGQPGDIGDQAKETARTVVESTIPVVGLAGRIKDKGPAALNPFNPIKPKGASSSGSSSSDPETEKLLKEVSGSGSVDADEVDKLLREVSP